MVAIVLRFSPICCPSTACLLPQQFLKGQVISSQSGSRQCVSPLTIAAPENVPYQLANNHSLLSQDSQLATYSEFLAFAVVPWHECTHSNREFCHVHLCILVLNNPPEHNYRFLTLKFPTFCARHYHSVLAAGNNGEKIFICYIL